MSYFHSASNVYPTTCLYKPLYGSHNDGQAIVATMFIGSNDPVHHIIPPLTDVVPALGFQRTLKSKTQTSDTATIELIDRVNVLTDVCGSVEPRC